MTTRLAARLGLRGRLILPMLVAFAVLAGVIVWQALEDRAERIDSARMRVLHNAQLIAARQQSIMARADALLHELAQLPELRPGAPAGKCARLLADRLGHEPLFVNIGVTLPDGSLSCSAVPPRNPPVSYADREWLHEALKSDRMVVGNVVTGHIVGKPLVPLARAVHDEAGRVSAVIFLALDLAWLHHELARAELPEGARLVVVDAKGTVAVRHPDPEGWVGKSTLDQPIFKAIQAGGAEGALEETGLEGTPRILAYTPLGDTASGRMTLWLSVPKATVLAPANRELAIGLSVMLVSLFLALGLAYRAGEKILMRPLLRLSDTATRFGAGDHAARTGLPPSDDEIGQLARMLDEAAEKIEAAERHLFRANRALRVLSAGNRSLLRIRGEQALLDEMCRVIVEAGGYRMAWVGYAEHDLDKSVKPMAAWGVEADFLKGLKITWSEAESGRGPTGTAIRKGIPAVSNDCLNDPECAPWREDALAHGIASVLALPLRVEGAVIGALCICSTEKDAFDSEVVELLSESADDLAYGIAAQRAEDAHARTRGKLKTAEADLAEAHRLAGIGHWEWDTRSDAHTWSEEIYRIYGRDPNLPPAGIQEVPGYFTPESWARLSAAVEAALAQGMTYECDAEVVRPDGTRRWITARGETMRDADGAAIGLRGTVQDITARKLGEIALERVNRTLRTLSAGNEALVRATDEAQLLDAACRVIVEQGGYRMAWVGYADDNPERTVAPKAWAGVEEGYLAQLHLTWADAERGQGPVSRAIRSGEAQIVHDIHTDPGYALWRELAAERGFASAFVYPLRASGKVIGTLGIYAAEADAFGQREIELLTELGDDLAFGIETLRTRAERDRIAHAHEHHAEILRQSLEESLRAIAFTVEKRDPYTAGHERRVGELAVAIAREMGLPDEKIHGIQLAATVHDLGKIQIPAEILAKPGRITEIEFMLIKTHPQAGYDILKDVEFPWPIADIVWQHHEKLDGSGYPQGLKNGQILLESRIMTVADVVEAMASHRPYRPALGIEVALQEIERGCGSAYDPAVADACLKLFREKGFGWQA